MTTTEGQTTTEAKGAKSRQLHRATHAQMNDLSVRLVAIEQELHRVGLHATARATNRAVRAIGWEFAGDFDQVASAVNPDTV